MDRTPYRAAVRLYGLAEIYWSEIDTDHIAVDLLDLPCYRFLNVVHTWVIRRLNEEDRDMFDTRLNEPFEWEKRAPVTSVTTGDEELALMRAAMAG